MVLRLDSSSESTDCDAATGITADPFTGVQFGLNANGTLYYWNYENEGWEIMISGGNYTNGSYSGIKTEDLVYDNGTAYDYPLSPTIDLNWD